MTDSSARLRHERRQSLWLSLVSGLWSLVSGCGSSGIDVDSVIGRGYRRRLTDQRLKTKDQRPVNRSHPVVLRTPAAFRRNPGNDAVRVHDVAGLAMHAVRGVDLQ